jgi:hypothetical protein
MLIKITLIESINVMKCNSILFCKTHSSINFNYSINNSLINQVQSIKDLGVIFSFNLFFNNHMTVFVMNH